MIAETLSLHSRPRTILNVEDLPWAPSRCRSSIVCSSKFKSSSTQSHCHQLFHKSLSSKSPSLTGLMEKNLSNSKFRDEFFLRLSRHSRLLFVLNDYRCCCGCEFAIERGSFVLLNTSESSSNNENSTVAVISNRLICSKIPSSIVCDLNSIRERVRFRSAQDRTVPSFDL